MFPIPWNKAFRKKDGTVVNIADAMSGGGGSDLPEHSISDAGKVLTVGDDGSLKWDEAGAGGGDEVILDYFEIFEASGSHEYTNEISIAESGTYGILIGGFCSTVIVKKNNVTIPNSFDAGGSFAHYFHNSEMELSANDVISITMSSSGSTVFFANVVKKATE